MRQTLAPAPPLAAVQQPQWGDAALVEQTRAVLAASPPLIDVRSLRSLQRTLAAVAAGEVLVVQAGDCAEDPAECTSGDVARKTGLLNLLAGVLKMKAEKPVVRVGRIAGQYAKPRSCPTELIDGRELPVFRGHLVNGPSPDPKSRATDPLRMLTCYRAASEVIQHLGWRHRAQLHGTETPVWTSHEALVLDYETALLRRDSRGRQYLSSTHWPWIGERTRNVEEAHVAMLAQTINPVACKVGPGMGVDELIALADRLDPTRQPGRLTLIARMGAGVVAEALPPLVAAMRATDHPVSWLCDPMHGNTVITGRQIKTRHVTDLVREVIDFQGAVRGAGGVAGGLHLETTPDPVRECLDADGHIDEIGTCYTSLCDPRLNRDQAVAVVSAWHAGEQ